MQLDKLIKEHMQKFDRKPDKIKVGRDILHALMRTREMLGTKTYQGIPVEFDPNLSSDGVKVENSIK